jgi:hypothetical protein
MMASGPSRLQDACRHHKTTVESEKRGEICPERHASLVAPAARSIVMASGRLSCPTLELLFEHRLRPGNDVGDIGIFSGYPGSWRLFRGLFLLSFGFLVALML